MFGILSKVKSYTISSFIKSKMWIINFVLVFSLSQICLPFALNQTMRMELDFYALKCYSNVHAMKFAKTISNKESNNTSIYITLRIFED